VCLRSSNVSEPVARSRRVSFLGVLVTVLSIDGQSPWAQSIGRSGRGGKYAFARRSITAYVARVHEWR
jgi:hypothetical protein